MDTTPLATSPDLTERIGKLKDWWGKRAAGGSGDKTIVSTGRPQGFQAADVIAARRKENVAKWTAVEARAKSGKLTMDDYRAVRDAEKFRRRTDKAEAPPAPRVAPTGPAPEGAMAPEQVERGKKVTVRTTAGTYEGEYALVNPDAITLSHTVEGQRKFNPNPKYKGGANDQPRDYTDAGEAARVEDLRAKFEREGGAAVRLMVNTNPEANSGIPAVTESGEVLNGTKRLLAKRTLDLRGKGAVYDKTVDEEAASFGFKPEQVAAARKKWGKVEVVRVVKGIKPGSKESAAFAREGNIPTETGQNVYRTAEAWARLIDDKVINKVEVRPDATVAETFTGPEATEYRTALRRAIGKAAPNRMAEFFEGENLTEAGKQLATNVALVKVLPPDAVESLPNSWRGTLGQVLPQLVEAKQKGGKANFLPQLQEALRLRVAIEERGMPFDAKSINLAISQGSMFGEKKLTLSPGANMIVDALDRWAGSPAKFRGMLKSFMEGDLFTEGVQNPTGRWAKLFGVVERTGATFGEKRSAPTPTAGEAAGAPLSPGMRKRLAEAKEIKEKIKGKLGLSTEGTPRPTRIGAEAGRDILQSVDIELGKSPEGKVARKKIRDVEQRLVGLHASYTDIATRIRTENKLKHSEFEFIGSTNDPAKFASLAPAALLKDPRMVKAGQQMAKLNREFKTMAEEAGVMVRTQVPTVDGGMRTKWVPLSEVNIEQYWRHSWGKEFQKQIKAGSGKIYEEALTHLVATKQAKTPEEAKTMLAKASLHQTGTAPSWADMEEMLSEVRNPGGPQVKPKVHWGGFEERRLDLPPSAYAYKWSEVGPDMARGYSRMIAGVETYGQSFEKMLPALEKVYIKQGPEAARRAYTAMMRQLGMDPAGPMSAAGRLAVGLSQKVGWSIMSSPNVAFLKNTTIGLPQIFAATGLRSTLAGGVQTAKQIVKSLGDRIAGRPRDWTRAQSSGAIEAGLSIVEQSFGKRLARWASPWYRGTETLLRTWSVESGLHRMDRALRQVAGSTPETARWGFRDKNQKAAWRFLTETMNLDRAEIATLQKLQAGGMHYRDMATLQGAGAKILNKAGYWASANIQGVTTPRSLPLFMTTEAGKAGSLFYRMIYAGTVNNIRNIFMPMAQGDVLPAVRYIAGTVLAGEALMGLNYLLFGKEHPSKDAKLMTRLWDDSMKAESLGPLSGILTSSGRGISGAGGIVALDSAVEVAKTLYAMAGRKEFVGQGVHDIASRSMGLYRDVVNIIEANRSPEYVHAKAAKAQVRNIAVREGLMSAVPKDYEKTTISPYTRMVRAAFWSDDKKSWQAAFKSTMVHIMDNENETVTEARVRIAQAIATEAPFPRELPLKDRLAILGKLDDAGRTRMLKAQADFETRKKLFLDATGISQMQRTSKAQNQRLGSIDSPRLRALIRQRIEERETQRARQMLKAM